MAACIPYVQWLQYNAACKAKTSTLDVKGFGYTRTGVAGLRGLRGLGDISFSVTPASIANAVQSGQLITSAPSSSPTPPVISQPTLNTTPVYNDPNDPCYLASQTPCPAGTACPASCPTGWHSIDMIHAPGTPVTCGCGRNPTASAPAAPGPSSGQATAPASNGGGITTATMVPQTSTAGFSHWGLLAALAVGGGALYLVMKKKN